MQQRDQEANCTVLLSPRRPTYTCTASGPILGTHLHGSLRELAPWRSIPHVIQPLRGLKRAAARLAGTSEAIKSGVIIRSVSLPSLALTVPLTCTHIALRVPGDAVNCITVHIRAPRSTSKETQARILCSPQLLPAVAGLALELPLLVPLRRHRARSEPSLLVSSASFPRPSPSRSSQAELPPRLPKHLFCFCFCLPRSASPASPRPAIKPPLISSSPP